MEQPLLHRSCCDHGVWRLSSSALPWPGARPHLRGRRPPRRRRARARRGWRIGAKDLVEAKDVALAAGSGRARRAALPGRRAALAAAGGHLDAAWTAVVEALRADWFHELPLVVGGRSSGARVACRTAAATGAVGVLCLAFPLQPPQGARPEPRPSRLGELEAVAAEVLIVQGENDSFGMPAAAPRRTVCVVAGRPQPAPRPRRRRAARRGMAAAGRCPSL